jgi:transposase-like protein
VPIWQVAENVGVARQTLHLWLARYEAEGLRAVDRRHRRQYLPAATRAAVVAEPGAVDSHLLVCGGGTLVTAVESLCGAGSVA